MALYFIPKYKVLNEKFFSLSNDDIANVEVLSNLSEQMKQLTALLEISADELAERQATCAEILQILRKFYPDSSLTIFGSSMNSFGVKKCDLDLLFLPFPGYSNLDYAANEGVKEKPQIPDPASILSGEVSNNVLAKFDEFSHLKFIRTVLKREKIGKRASFVPDPKYSILRVFLNNKKIICDISASNRLVVFNSELLQFFEKLDERVKPLVICLRYWARSLGFIKWSFFSSYSFTLLVIFFLQSIFSPILPSVRHLIELSGISRMTAGWQTAFCTDVKSVPKSKNTQTVGELMIQFFEFYLCFDFSRYVVSPHNGKPLLIEDIKSSMDERMTSFDITSLNIQDVFVLSSNVCKMEKVAVFKLCLLTAREMLKSKEKVKFHSLFNPNAYQYIFDIHYRKFMIGSPRICFINLDYECLKNFDNLQPLYEKASETVYEVLQYGLLMECEVTDKVYNCKKKNSHLISNKDSGFSRSPMQPLKSNPTETVSTPYDLQLLVSIQCVAFSRTWTGRKNAQVTASDPGDDLEVFADAVLSNEYCVSKSLLSKNTSLSSPVPILCFKCDCYRHVNPELKHIIVLLKPLAASKEFSQVSTFLASYIPKTVKKILTSK